MKASLILLFLFGAAQGASTSREAELVKSLMDNYDASVRPSVSNATHDKLPTVVEVNLYVRSIPDISVVDMVFKTQLTFRMRWTDERLRYNVAGGMDYINLPPEDGKKLWKPDLFFSNEIAYRKHDGLTPNEYYRVSPNGEVLYSTRISLTLSCPMLLKNFPFDNQVCSIRMASYGYTTRDVIFKWKIPDPVQVTSDLHLPSYALNQFVTDYCNSITSTGEYSCLRLNLHFAREINKPVQEVYSPMALTILVVWLSMFLHPVQQCVARTLLLASCTFYSSWTSVTLSKLIPNISYGTAFDCWKTWCNIFLLVAFVEFIFAYGLSLNEKETDDLNSMQTSRLRRVVTNWKYHSVGRKLDILARILYPIAFLFVIGLYWAIYVRNSKDYGIV